MDGRGPHARPRRRSSSGPAEELQEGTPAAFEFSSNEPDAEFECALDPADPEPGRGSSGAAAPRNPAEFDEPAGEHTLLVRAVDPSANADASPAEYSWTVVGEPVTTIQSGPPASPDTTSERTATFTFAADQTGVDYKCSLDSAPFTGCESGVEYTNLALGDHSFEVQASNRYGLVEDPPASREWTIVLAPDTTRARDDDRVRTRRDQRERAGTLHLLRQRRRHSGRRADLRVHARRRRPSRAPRRT